MWYLLLHAAHAQMCVQCSDTSAHLDVLHIWMFCTLPRAVLTGYLEPGLMALDGPGARAGAGHVLGAASSCPAALPPPALPLGTHISVHIMQSRSKGCCPQQCSHTECVEDKALLCSCAHCHFSQAMAAAKSAPNQFSKQCSTAYMLRGKPRLAAFNAFPSLFLCIKINFMNFPR